MAFLPYMVDDGSVPPWEYLPAEAITPKLGLCLAFDSSSGQLELSETPEYICMKNADEAVTAGDLIPVIRIDSGIIFETALDAATSFEVGATVDVDLTGLLVDADSSSDGVFQLTWMAGQGSGDKVRGRFI
jgi:hypothetical protein